MAYVWLQRIRLTESHLSSHLYACRPQHAYGSGNNRKKYPHYRSSFRRKSSHAWCHRHHMWNLPTPVCHKLSLSQLPPLDQNSLTGLHYSSRHSFHSAPIFFKEGSSSGEQGSGVSKDGDKKNAETSGSLSSVPKPSSGDAKSATNTAVQPAKPTLLERLAKFNAKAREVGYITYAKNGLMAFLKHLWDGLKLIWTDIRISAPLLWKYIRKGRSAMKRRELRQLTRTLADLIRMVPLIATVVIPFAELLVPLLVAKGLFPKAFITKEQQSERDRQKLQKKLEYGALLSESLKQMSRVKTNQEKGTYSIEDFTAFIEKVKSTEMMPTNEEIIKFSRLFQDELTLDDLRVDQLQGLCKILGIDFIGQIPSERILRFQIEVKLRELMVDDKLIQKEGLESLAIWELQQACRARGMRAVGVSEQRLRLQLQQWLELHLREEVPSSLLLLSRVMYLDENLSPAEALKHAISGLSESTVDKVKVQSAEVDKKTKIKVLHEEQKLIKEQNKKEAREKAAEAAAKPIITPPLAETKEPEKVVDEVLVDKAEPLKDIAAEIVDTVAEASQLGEKVVEEIIEPDITSQDLGDIEKAIEDMSRHEKNEIEEVREGFQDYTEVVRSLSLKETKVDSKGAKKLQTKLARYLDDLNVTIDDLNQKRAALQEKLEIEQVQLKHKETMELKEAISDKKHNLVSINEVLLSLRRLQKLPDDIRMQKVLEVLDDDQDGLIDINDVLKVTEALIRENLKLNKTQVATMMNLLRKEHELELEQKLQEKEKQKEEKSSNGTSGEKAANTKTT